MVERIQRCIQYYLDTGEFDPRKAMWAIEVKDEEVDSLIDRKEWVERYNSYDEEMSVIKRRIKLRTEIANHITSEKRKEYERDIHESYIAEFIDTLFEEAFWIDELRQFPNGKPYGKQSPLMLYMWKMLLAVVWAMKQGYKPKGSPR